MNNIKAIIDDIAIEKKDLKMVKEIKQELLEKLDILPQQLNRYLKNTNQPNGVYLSQILEVLNKHNPELTLDDVIGTPQKTKAKKVTDKLFS